MEHNRQYVLGGLLVGLLALSAVVLGAVLQTVVFAVTVAYVLYPLKRWLVRRVGSDRIASAIATLTAFFAVALVSVPIGMMLYQRRGQLVDTLRSVPDTITVSVAGTEFSADTEPFIESAVTVLQDIAVAVAVSAPGLVLQFGLFTLLLYGLLYKPRAIRAAILGAVPDAYHDVIARMHSQTKRTLYSLYVLQASTAAATFVIASVLFWVLGYGAPLSLGLLAGILQFIPILGPSLLVVALVLNDVLLGNPVRALSLLALGLVFISFVPDAVIRTKLAGTTGEIAPSLYFVGFVGGILTVGALGIIVGPLVVALLVEAVKLLSERVDTEYQRLPEVE